jgi:hypothetical protein
MTVAAVIAEYYIFAFYPRHYSHRICFLTNIDVGGSNQMAGGKFGKQALFEPPDQ